MEKHAKALKEIRDSLKVGDKIKVLGVKRTNRAKIHTKTDVTVLGVYRNHCLVLKGGLRESYGYDEVEL